MRTYTGTLSMLGETSKCVWFLSIDSKERTLKGWQTVWWNEETPLCVCGCASNVMRCLLTRAEGNSQRPCNPVRTKKKGTAVLLQVLSNRQDCVLSYSVCDIEIFIRLNATTTITRLVVKEHRWSPAHCRVAAHTLFTCARTLPTDS